MKSQGIVDVVEERWYPARNSLVGRSKVVDNDSYELRVIIPVGPQARIVISPGGWVANPGYTIETNGESWRERISRKVRVYFIGANCVNMVVAGPDGRSIGSAASGGKPSKRTPPGRGPDRLWIWGRS